MSRISVVTHKGKPVLVQDFSGLRAGIEFQESIAEAKRFMAGQPPKSVLSVFDATGTVYNVETLAAMKDFAKHNEPYVKASAVVGVEGIKNIALVAVSRFSGRTFGSFKDRAAAMDWVVEQP